MSSQANCATGLKRYRVVKGSESAHCCFEATVIDTKREVHGRPDWVCECFDLARAHAITDAMNIADDLPLNEKTPGPVFQDRCGKEFDVHSGLLYFPNEGDPRLILPLYSDIDLDTGHWELHISTFVDNHQYSVCGTMFKKHPGLLKLEASGEELLAAI